MAVSFRLFSLLAVCALAFVRPSVAIPPYETCDPNELADVAAEDNVSVFNRAYETYRREVFVTAYTVLGDAHDAEQISSEVYARYWEWLERGEEIRQVRSWLVRVAKNLALDYLKSAFRKIMRGDQTMRDFAVSNYRGESRDPLDTAMEAEEQRLLISLLEKLPSADKEVLTLYYGRDILAAELAVRLGIRANAVHMRLSRARQRFMEIVESDGRILSIP